MATFCAQTPHPIRPLLHPESRRVLHCVISHHPTQWPLLRPLTCHATPPHSLATFAPNTHCLPSNTLFPIFLSHSLINPQWHHYCCLLQVPSWKTPVQVAQLQLSNRHSPMTCLRYLQPSMAKSVPQPHYKLPSLAPTHPIPLDHYSCPQPLSHMATIRAWVTNTSIGYRICHLQHTLIMTSLTSPCTSLGTPILSLVLPQGSGSFCFQQATPPLKTTMLAASHFIDHFGANLVPPPGHYLRPHILIPVALFVMATFCALALHHLTGLTLFYHVPVCLALPYQLLSCPCLTTHWPPLCQTLFHSISATVRACEIQSTRPILCLPSPFGQPCTGEWATICAHPLFNHSHSWAYPHQFRPLLRQHSHFLSTSNTLHLAHPS